MSLIPASMQKIQNERKPEKKFQEIEKLYHPTSNTPNEILKEQISEKLSANIKEKREKKNTCERNQSFLRRTNKEVDTKILIREKSFTSSLQDFPALKVFNGSNLSEPNEENRSKFGYNKVWASKKKKNEAFPPLSATIRKADSKPDCLSEKKTLTQSKEINAGNVNEEQCKPFLNIENSEKKKLLSMQETSVQSKIISKKKKRSDPIFISPSDILKANKTRTKLKRSLKSKIRRRKDTEQLSGNYLDSSNPKRLRGKHREVKKKRLTSLKLTILKERIVKQKLKENCVANCFGNDTINFINSIDFKTEIKMYLKDLSERKLKQTDKNLNNKIKKTSSSENINVEFHDCEKHRKVDKIIPATTPEGNFKFSSKFREYCNNIITPDLNSAVSNLIKESVNLQDKAFLRDPIKAKAKKRHVTGIREVRKYLIMKKTKLIVIAPNLENLKMEGSLHDIINDLKSAAQAQNVPYVFALDRYKLGRFTKKNLPVSAFALLSYEGIEGLFGTVLDQLQKAKAKFSEMVKPNVEKENNIKTEDINSKVIASFISAFQKELQISD